MNDKWFLGVVILLIIAMIIFGLNLPKKSVKQPWTQIDLGAYGPNIDPRAYTEENGWNILYNGDKATAKALVDKWYKFVEAVGPEISGVIYAMFPNLQTRESIRYYGLVAKMIRDLTAISPLLDSPQSIKTMEDIHRVFDTAAIKSFSMDMNERPQSGLYENTASYGNYIDVV
jgi:hypothetical protein